MDVFNGTGYLLRTPAGTEPVAGIRVSDGFFRTLGVSPMLGRDFYAGEDLPSAPKTVILSYATWQKRFGGRKDAVGETVSLSGMPYTIVGVLPQSFQFALGGKDEFWTTLHASDSVCPPTKLPQPHGNWTAQGWSLRRDGSGRDEDDCAAIGAAVSQRQSRPGGNACCLWPK